jgi:hypothetical protein
MESISQTLGLHPDYTRQGLLVWKETKLKLSSVEGHRVGSPEVSEPVSRTLQADFFNSFPISESILLIRIPKA